MKRPSREPVTTPDQLLTRVADLVGPASERQLWLMFLDADDIQSPILMPTAIPARPSSRDAAPFSTFLSEVVKATECHSIAVTLERPGPSVVSDDDVAWFRLLETAGCLARVRLRGPLLSSSDGVRLVEQHEIS
ncbi:MAG: hypothetical protein JWN80_1612 [Microbacteriaceae bacterium]|jgi:hypothetical protein|nr:hypothetical protein [Microbacteriaceae bacterium]